MNLSQFYDDFEPISNYRDWRLSSERMEGFLRWLKWRLKYYDLDHYGPNNAYRDYASMSKEQQYWFSLIFGMTYQSEMAWVIFNQFPDFNKIDEKKLEDWNLKNLSRQKYAKDTKYNKGRIVSQFNSIWEQSRKFGSLTDYIESSLSSNDPQSFDNTYKKIGELHKYGRMTQWITCQVLYETAGLPIHPNTMLAWDDSAWSVRSGLMYLFNKDEKIEAKDHSLKLDKEDIQWVLEIEPFLLNQCKEYLKGTDLEISNYLLESHLCQYKKLMLGGDYAGHSTGDHYSRAVILDELWSEIDFKPFYDFHDKHHYHLLNKKTENKALRNLTMKTGQMINMHEDFEDMPNMYDELGISISDISNDPISLKKINGAIAEYAEKIQYSI